MKRKLLIILVLLLISGTAGAKVDVFYLPESGFLRVSGEILINPSARSLSALVFPTAHVTEFWTDHLTEYHVQPGAQGTIVQFSLNEAGPQTLNLSYEGYLEPQMVQATLDRDNLWFPEFSFPFQSPEITVEPSPNWELVAEDEFSQGYPAIQLKNTTAPQDDQKQGTAPVVKDYISRIQMQVTRLTNAMSLRNESGIELLLSSDLRSKGLAAYLSSLSLFHGSITSELITNPTYLQDEFEVLFTTDRGAQYVATMTWQEGQGRLQLRSFRLTPYQPDIPPEVRHSLEQFLQDLKWAVQVGDTVTVASLLDIGLARQQDQVLELLMNLNPYATWSLEYVNLDPFAISVLVDHERSKKLLFDIELAPGEDHWLIRGIRIIPLD